jgi:hypothetical protein
MNSRLFHKGILATAIVLPALSGAARAQNTTDDFGCSNATLKGEYAFGVTNYEFPLVVAGIQVFDGKGNFTQRDYQGDSLRTTGQSDFSPKGQERGTYIVNPDCTGSMVLNLNVPVPTGSTGVVKNQFVISNGGRHIHQVVSEFTPPGSTTGPVPTQASVDDWKVAAD